MKFGDYRKIGSLSSVASFSDYLGSHGIDIPCDEVIEAGPDSPLSAPLAFQDMTVGHRIGINPMEGWDGEIDGRPSANTRRRWRRFGLSGGKLIWGGEAVAVRADGRANPNQLILAEHTQREIAELRQILVDAHREATGNDRGLVVGLQLTHSGRFCKPNDHRRFEPHILYNHPLLDRKFGYPPDQPVMDDSEISRLVDDFVRAAKRTTACGFDFVDLKACHGYIGHEFLSAFTRPGRYGGSLENRTRFLREIVEGVRAEAPGMRLAVRFSAIDIVPFRPDPGRSAPGAPGPGVPEDVSDLLPYHYAFGANQDNPVEWDLSEPKAFLEILRGLGICLVNVTAGSPYYNPHIQRPALYPPSDGYAPPEDPLIGVARQLAVTRELKRSFPDFCIMGTGYTYLQEFLPNVAQAAVRRGWVDVVGLGRMVLAYPELPLDILSGKGAQKKRLCRTFSDCTTAPRNGLVSGCYPLDTFYKKSEQAKSLAALKNR
jgi:NADPH2 dehydrogenase